MMDVGICGCNGTACAVCTPATPEQAWDTLVRNGYPPNCVHVLAWLKNAAAAGLERMLALFRNYLEQLRELKRELAAAN